MRLDSIEIKDIVDSYVDLASKVLVIDTDKVVIDDYIIVDQHCEYKLDLIAEITLGSKDDSDVLLIFNNLINPYIEQGQVLKIPNKDSLKKHSNYIDFKMQQSSINTTSTTLSPSTKTVKTKNYTNTNGVLKF